MGDSWFFDLFGQEEPSGEAVLQQVQELFRLEPAGEVGEDPSSGDLIYAPNGKVFRPGVFETPSLRDLRSRLQQWEEEHDEQKEQKEQEQGQGQDKADGEAGGQPASSSIGGRKEHQRLTFTNRIAEARELHVHADAARSCVQVASQFNCLEFIDSAQTPEDGITKYLYDKSQGPACALACAASTLWRNYFVPMRQGRGQRSGDQLNLLDDVSSLLGGDALQVRNGYASSSSPDRLIDETWSEDRLDEVRQALKIGIQWNAQVTDCRRQHKKNPETKKWEMMSTEVDPVTQVFCSTVKLHPSSSAVWAPFCKLLLEAAYEACFLAAILNRRFGGSKRLFLTSLGGGNFHNEPDWIRAAIARALELFAHVDLDVQLVHFSGGPHMEPFKRLEDEWKARRKNKASDQ